MTAPRTPDWLVERLLAGELPPEEAARVRARLEAEGGLARLDALARDDAAFPGDHPPGPALAEIRRRAGGPGQAARRAPGLRWLAPAVLAAAAALVAVPLLRAGAPRVGPDAGGEDVRLKGQRPELRAWRQAPSGATERLRDGDVARGGERVQLSYLAGGARRGAVISLDGRGAVTLHWPEQGGAAPPLEPGGAVALPHAYLLDDAPRFERFFLVTADAPFDSAAVVDAARRLAGAAHPDRDPLPLPPGLEQSALLLRKDVR